MSVPGTGLQAATREHAALVLALREHLSGEQYGWFVATALVLLEREASRLELGNLVRLLRDEDGRA